MHFWRGALFTAAITTSTVPGVLSLSVDHHSVDHADVHQPSDSERGRSAYASHEKHEPGHVDGWVKRERPDPKARLPMRIGLRQSNLEAGHELLMDM